MLTTASAWGAPDSAPDAAAQRFFGAVRKQDYRAAYGMLSPGVRRDVPYREFVRRSRDIKRFKVLELVALDRGNHLVRFRVKGQLRMVYKGDLYDAVYAGTADMTRSDKTWFIGQVDLKPIKEKRVGPAPPGYHI